MLTVGVPKEIKPLEKRAGLGPEGARQLTQKGIRVLVQSGAGEHSGFPDADYQKAGAEILESGQKIYAQAGLVQKVKEPLEPEFPLLRPGQIIFSFLHLASPENCKLVKILQEKKITAIGYETLEVNGRLPLLAPMSEMAGSLSAAYAAYLLNSLILSPAGAKDDTVLTTLEKIAAQYPNFKNPGSFGKVVIWGGGVAGQAALCTVLKLRGQAAVIEKNPAKREFLKQWTPEVYGPEEKNDAVLAEADVWIGSVHVRGTRALKVLTGRQLADFSRKKKKIIMDISIDQGGNFPESRPATYEDPVYRDSCGNLRFCVANIPSLCGRAATEALTQAALPYTIKLAQGTEQAFQDPDLRRAVNIFDGRILIPEIQQAHQEKTAETGKDSCKQNV